jgi:hypothetical protein
MVDASKLKWMIQSMFTSTIESPVKRAKVPGVKRAQTEQIPYVVQSFLRLSAHTCSTVHKYFTVSIKHNTTKNGRTKFRVDRQKALRSASGFVTAALLQISFSEPIDLTHEDPSIVKSYLTWINTGKVSNQKQPRWFSSDKKVKHLALCYGLGERLQDVKYRNDILCKIQYHVVTEGLFPSDSAVAIIYENTKRGSPARQMMVDFWAYEGSEDWLQSKTIRSAIHLEFLEDLVPALLRLREKPVGESRPWVDTADAYLVEE